MEQNVDYEPPAGRSDASFSPCPVDRMPRRSRNKLCVAIIAVGALNFVVYTIVYAALGGDAHNGEIRLVEQLDGSKAPAYYVRGHFIRSLAGQEAQVTRRVWIYSYLHSMSMFVTSAAMIVSMLVLARPHILATMRDDWISGRTFVTVFGTIVVLVTSGAIFIFAWDFIAQLGLE